jgi:hypothetical protein
MGSYPANSSKVLNIIDDFNRELIEIKEEWMKDYNDSNAVLFRSKLSLQI